MFTVLPTMQNQIFQQLLKSAQEILPCMNGFRSYLLSFARFATSELGAAECDALSAKSSSRSIEMFAHWPVHYIVRWSDSDAVGLKRGKASQGAAMHMHASQW